MLSRAGSRIRPLTRCFSAQAQQASPGVSGTTVETPKERPAAGQATKPVPSLIDKALEHQAVADANPIVSELTSSIWALGQKKQPQFLALKKNGSHVIGEVSVNSALLGAKGTPVIVSETSMLDKDMGIKYRGYTLEYCNALLPSAQGSKVGLPEAAWWLLMTGEIPTDTQVAQLNEELHRRESLPENVIKTIDSLGKNVHPMTQLSMGLLALQPYSHFNRKYRDGMKKKDYWMYTLEDSLDMVAKVPILSARIFRNVFFDGNHIPSDHSLDWAANYAQMLGVNDSDGFKDMMRLYLMIHADHEGGNVSAHTTHLVASALSDPYLAFSAGVNGLAGPLHGLANQECLRWLKKTKEALGDQEPTVEIMTKFAKDTLASGQVIPGFGHGALRITDPRYIIQRDFALENFPDNELLKLANVCFEAIPPVLAATGKVKNPWPNVDALSGTCISYYGMTQEDYYTVIFAVSRTLGVSANMVWSRLMGLPIERPKSVTLDWLQEQAEK
mmetsp:Transcript_8849/g.15226  ORF Transcript_8849/g.15226 Transcript_8849/m.15226 type:complete len:502 (+) Transcript_8849:77-1582(+)